MYGAQFSLILKAYVNFKYTIASSTPLFSSGQWTIAYRFAQFEPFQFSSMQGALV